MKGFENDMNHDSVGANGSCMVEDGFRILDIVRDELQRARFMNDILRAELS